MTPQLCLLAAIASMLLYGLASVSQSAATRRASGAQVMLHPLYVVGLVADGLAWAASLLALVRLPLVVVQPILAGSVAVAVLLAVPILKARLRRADALGIGLTTIGLVLVSMSAGAESTAAVPGWFTTACLVGVVVCGALAGATYSHGPAAGTALTAGLSFAGAALAGRALVAEADLASLGGFVHLLVDPLAWSVAGFGALGTWTYARALERGGLGLATSVMWVVEAVLPAVVGVVALDDAVRPGWAPAVVVGLALAVAGCGALAFSPAQEALAE